MAPESKRNEALSTVEKERCHSKTLSWKASKGAESLSIDGGEWFRANMIEIMRILGNVSVQH